MPVPSCETSASLPWIGSPRIVRPPKASTIDWWPRQTPSVGTPASGNARAASIEIPASAGVHGPGEITRRSAPRSSSSATSALSFLTTSTSAPSSPRNWTRL